MSDKVSKIDKSQQYINEHKRLADLFVDNQFAFEQERKRLITEAIESMNGNHEMLWSQQKELDTILKGAGSPENRFAMIQALFWHHMVNNWQPQMRDNAATLSKLVVGGNSSQPRLSLVR